MGRRAAKPGDVLSHDNSVEPGVWRLAKARRASVIVDAQDYFRHIECAMEAARRRISLVGWDFDTRIHLTFKDGGGDKGGGHPSRLGPFVLWLVRRQPNLEVRILKWSYGLFRFVTRGMMLVDLMRWARHPRIEFKFDKAHPVGCSHHQKIAVIDGVLAVCGGIDMTGDRRDSRDHLEVEPRRIRPGGQPYEPWHDATMMLEGEVAGALEELVHDRWANAGGGVLSTQKPDEEGAVWPATLDAQFENVEVGIARTRAAYRGAPQVEEVAQLFVRQIQDAKQFIYAESQYFASRRIADAICERLSQPEPPEILIVHPRNADGWLEQQAMDSARARLIDVLGALDSANRFGLYVPYTGETPIYVHAKLMIVDDRILRIGSANMNNRSMGLDSECDVFIDAGREGNGHASGAIRALRHSLLAEHCGLDDGEVAGLLEQHGSMIAMIEALGQQRSRTLRRFDHVPAEGLAVTVADSGMLDPEHADEMFEPFAKGGLFRHDSRIARARHRLKGFWKR